MGKGSGQKVYDYLYSLDFGLCHGPIDSINMVWVKEKPIFCGAITERTNVCIDMPDLFGGDLKEGGVFGVVEFYPGGDTQTASIELASREGLTPETFPGYRGQAHVFFRGYGGTGFKWATNNYYLPTAEFHLTNLPKRLGTTHSAIWPMGEEPPPNIEMGVWQGHWIPFDTVAEYGPSADVQPGRIYMPYVDKETLVADLPGKQGAWERLDPYVEPTDCEVILSGAGYIPTGKPDEETDENGQPLTSDDALASRMRKKLVGVSVELRVKCEYLGSISGIDPTSVTATVRLQTYEGGYNDEGQEVVGRVLTTNGDVRIARGTSYVTTYVPVPPTAQWIRRWGTYNAMFPLFTQTSIELIGGQAFYARDIYQHCLADGQMGAMPDANPAHMIYETLVNEEWGKGELPHLIDTESFHAAAETLYNERFGLSMMWTRQDSIEAFIQEILDHIKGFLFQNPATGLWTLKLLRGDYTASTLPWLTPDNATLRNPKRRRWGETVNEITVSYTDPDTEDAATVTAQNLANMAVQGGKNAETRNYYGIRNANLAQTVANRDVVEAGTPLWGGTFEVDRTMWQTKPGDVLRVNWPEENIESMVVRVMAVDYGKKGSRTIKLTTVEDIFSADTATFTTPQQPVWQSDAEFPLPAQYRLATAVPLPEMLRGGADVNELETTEQSAVAVMAATPGKSVRDYEFWWRPPNKNTFTLTGTAAPLGVFLLPSPLAEEATSLIPRAWIDAIGGGFLQPNSRLMLVRPGASLVGGIQHEDRYSEILILRTFNALTQEWTVQRGAYDTVPVAWPAGSALWQYPDGEEYISSGSHARLDEFSMSFRVLPRTRIARLSLAAADTFSSRGAERLRLPFRPANCQIDNNGFDPLIYEPEPWPDTVRASWSNRNRFLEDLDVPPSWTEENIEPEDGSYVRLYLSRSRGGPWYTSFDAAPGATYYDIPVTAFATGTGGQCWVSFVARNADGDNSLQYAERFVRVGGIAGWDFNWNNNWGL